MKLTKVKQLLLRKAENLTYELGDERKAVALVLLEVLDQIQLPSSMSSHLVDAKNFWICNTITSQALENSRVTLWQKYDSDEIVSAQHVSLFYALMAVMYPEPHQDDDRQLEEQIDFFVEQLEDAGKIKLKIAR